MQLQLLTPEETLERAHRETAPRAFRLKTLKSPPSEFLGRFLGGLFMILGVCFVFQYVVPNHPSGHPLLLGIEVLSLILLMLTLLGTALFWIVARLYNIAPERAIARLTATLNPMLSSCSTTTSAPMLLDFLVWLEPSAQAERKRPLYAALVRLLPRVGEPALKQLVTPQHRKALRGVCQKQDDSELVRIALLVLGSVQDRKTIPIARRLRKQRPLLADAAEAFLDTMGMGSQWVKR